MYNDLVDSLTQVNDEEIRYKQWVKSEDDHLSRQSLCDTVQNVIAILKSKHSYFLQHLFIKRVPSNHFDNLKQNLSLGTLLIQTDFSKNCVHKVQDETQSLYWDTKSSTLYTAMAYYSKQDGDDVTLHSEQYVVVSDYEHHDKYAVVVFNEILLNNFKCAHEDVEVSRTECIPI